MQGQTLCIQKVDTSGWVAQPDQRGTIDIVRSCVATLFICVWVMLHLNVPAADDSRWTLLIRRIRWLILALLAPELVLLFASGQWASAKRSVVEMHDIGHQNWSLVHAFYADSGGFVLRAPESPEFPVTAKHIYYLLKKGHLRLPSLTKKEISDKSKADPFAKTIAVLQSSWLVVQVIARGISGLPITLLELTTVALVACTGFTFLFWFSKPLNVDTPTIVDIDIDIASILIEAGDAAKPPFLDTPLDFVEPQLYTSSQMPLHRFWGVQPRPLPRIPNDRDSRLHSLPVVLTVAFPTAIFTCLHLAAWNFYFPSRAEQLMWRWTCISSGVILGAGCFIEAASIVADNYTTSALTNLNGYKLRWPTNLLVFVPGALYFAARIVVIVEVIISLRALPSGCFENVQWTDIILHV